MQQVPLGQATPEQHGEPAEQVPPTELQQVPLVQATPEQTLLQLPQLLVVVRSVQAPLQQPWPVLHWLLQLPQLLVVVRSISQPLLGSPSQSAKPVLQVKP